MKPDIKRKLLSFFQDYQKVSFQKQKIVIESGKASNFTYLLTKGSVRIMSLTKSGVELTLNTFKPYSFFPIGSLINATVIEHPYETLTDCILYKAPNTKVLEFLKQNPDVQFDLLKRVFRGLDGYFQRMETVLTGDTQRRVIAEIIIYALRFGEKLDENSILIEVPHSKLASLTGLSRETVTRQIGKLKKKGILKYQGSKIKITNLNLLQDEIK